MKLVCPLLFRPMSIPPLWPPLPPNLPEFIRRWKMFTSMDTAQQHLQNMFMQCPPSPTLPNLCRTSAIFSNLITPITHLLIQPPSHLSTPPPSPHHILLRRMHQKHLIHTDTQSLFNITHQYCRNPTRHHSQIPLQLLMSPTPSQPHSTSMVTRPQTKSQNLLKLRGNQLL